MALPFNDERVLRCMGKPMPLVDKGFISSLKNIITNSGESCKHRRLLSNLFEDLCPAVLCDVMRHLKVSMCT